MIFSGKKERKTERKKERHLRQWKNEKMRVACTCLQCNMSTSQ